MNETALTALATVLLVVVGLAQVVVLISQKRQTRIALSAEYRRLWFDSKKHWGTVIFIGRDPKEYYQVVDETTLKQLRAKTETAKLTAPTIWAMESIQSVCGVLGEVSTRILQGHLKVSDTYAIFGTEFLRHSRPLRQLLDPSYPNHYQPNQDDTSHEAVRREMQQWLIYHDGLRRRCLILIDLLWAEAARLEDLPPHDMQDAAEAKKKTGRLNRKRVFNEVIRLNTILKIGLAIRLSRFLRRAEYQSFTNWIGIRKKRLTTLRISWTNRLLREN